MIILCRTLLRPGTKILHRTMSSQYLIDDSKYSFLKDLGLERVNNGVYNGKWGGSGPVSIIKPNQ